MYAYKNRFLDICPYCMLVRSNAVTAGDSSTLGWIRFWLQTEMVMTVQLVRFFTGLVES